MVPAERCTQLLAPPPPPPPPQRTRLPKDSTLEQMVQHARDYMQRVAETDPHGAALQRAALARHTQRLKERNGLDDDEELQVAPEAVEMITQHMVGRPRIVRQPEDPPEARQGRTNEIQLELEAHVRQSSWPLPLACETTP